MEIITQEASKSVTKLEKTGKFLSYSHFPYYILILLFFVNWYIHTDLVTSNQSKVLTDHNSNSQTNIIQQQEDENEDEETDEDDDVEQEPEVNVVLQALTQAANSQAILIKPAVPIQRKVEKAKWTEEEVLALLYYCIHSHYINTFNKR